MTNQKRFRVSFRFAWYDMWIGAFWDQKKRILYVCPLPMMLVVIETKGAP